MRSTKELRSARAAIFIGAILTVLAAAAIFFVMHMGDNKNLSERERQALAQTLYFPNPSENQQIGETESIVNNDPDHAVSIHHPVFGIHAIDLQVLEVVEDLQKGHREQLGQEQQTTTTDVQSDLLVDYQSYLVGDRTASMVLTVKEQFSTWSNARDRTIAMVFDLLEGRQLGLGDIFQNDYLERLSEGVRKSFRESSGNLSATETEQFLAGTTPDMDNFQNFALTTDAVRIYFEQGQIFPEQDGAPMAEIPYEDLAGALRIRTEGPLLSVAAAPEVELTEPEPVAVDPDRPMVALTFDDGPHPIVTPRILNLLKQYNARATFFVLGNRVDSYPDVLQREYTEGHEIGNHSYNHAFLSKLGEQEIAFQVQETDERISHLLPTAPVLLRPPYGAINDAAREAIQKPFVLWSIDTQDWKNRSSGAIASEVLEKVKDGDIILMHDLYAATADACEVILPALAAEGYQFVTVSELLEKRDIVPAAGQVYTHATA